MMLRDVGSGSAETRADDPWSDHHQRLAGALNVEDLRSKIHKMAVKLGFTDFNYRMLGDNEVCRLVTPGMASVCYRDDDMMLNHLACTGTAMLMSKIEQHIVDSPIDHQLYQDTYSLIRRYKCQGFNDLYYLPVDSSNGRRFGLSVGCKGLGKVEFLRLVKSQQEELVLLVQAIDYTVTKRFSGVFSAPRTADIVLPPRPLRVLKEMLENDLTLTQAADKLHISIHTANKHMAVIKQRLGYHTLAGGLFYLVQTGLLDTVLNGTGDR